MVNTSCGSYKNTQYFDNIEQANKFIKDNNIRDYCFTTPEYLENGVDLNWNDEISKIKVEKIEGYNCIRCMNEEVLHITIPNKSGNCSQGIYICRDCCKKLIKEIDDFITKEEFNEFITRKNAEISKDMEGK